MNISILKSKLHRVKVTQTELDYEGSCGIDANWMDKIGLHENEQIHIYNTTNGERFVTDTFKVEAGSKIISVNGAAAHKTSVGDPVVICAYGDICEKDAANHKPKILKFDY